MPDTKDVVQRQEDALAKIAKALGVEVRELRGEARGNPQLERALTLENIADAVTKFSKAKPAAETTEKVEAKAK